MRDAPRCSAFQRCVCAFVLRPGRTIRCASKRCAARSSSRLGLSCSIARSVSLPWWWGAESSAREGLKALVAAVGLGQVGLVLGIEVSRLARNNADWYGLLDLCSMTDTLIADADGLYHPATRPPGPGLERHHERGRAAPAARPPPCRRPTQGGQGGAARPAVGYDYDPDDRVVLCADER